MQQILDCQLLLILAAYVEYAVALVHHYQAVAVQYRVAHVVRDHHRGQLIAADNFVGGVQHLGRGLGVERGCVLVQQ